MPEETRLFVHALLGEVRTVLLDDVRWFNVMDLCNEFEITDASMAMQRISKEDSRQIVCATEFGRWKLWFVTERGAMRLLCKPYSKPAPRPPRRDWNRGETPPYRRIANSVRKQIQSGEFGPGDKLPVGKDMAEAWGVKPMTARRAYQLLRDEGLVEFVSGRNGGYHVREQADD